MAEPFHVLLVDDNHAYAAFIRDESPPPRRSRAAASMSSCSI
jgi:hypothetical protein